MGFTKKTWLALALAIVLVLGLSATALAEAAAPSSVTIGAIPTQLKTGATDNTADVKVTITPATGKTVNPGKIKLVSSDTKILTVETAEMAVDTTTTVAKEYTFKIKSVAPNATGATLLATYTPTTGSPVPSSASEAIPVVVSEVKFSKPTIDVVTASGLAGTFDTFNLVDAAGNKLSGATFTPAGYSDIATITEKPANSGTYEVVSVKVGKVEVTATYASVASTTKLTINVAPSEITFKSNADPSGDITIGGTPNSFNVEIADALANTTVLAGATLTSSNKDAVTITMDPNSADTVTKFTVTAAKAAKDVELTATYAGKTVKTGKFNVIDPKQVAEMFIQVKGEAATPYAALTEESAMVKDTAGNYTFPYLATAADNTYVITVPSDATHISPDTADAYDLITAALSTKKISWKSSNSKIVKILALAPLADQIPAHVKNNGTKFQIVGTGIVKLTASADNFSKVYTLKIGTQNPTGIVFADPISGTDANRKEMTLVPGQYLQTAASIFPAGSRNGKLYYKSSKKTVASVSSTGMVKGVKAGEATITVYTKKVGKVAAIKKTFKVTVKRDYSQIQQYVYTLITSAPANTQDGSVYAFWEAVDNSSLGKPVIPIGGSTTRLVRKSEVLAGIEDFATRSTGTNDPADSDMTIVYFTGDLTSTGLIQFRAETDATASSTMTVDELFTALSRIKGQVVLIMDCKMASTALTSKGLKGEMTPAQFNKMVLGTAAKKSVQAKTLGTAAAAGKFDKTKFKVLVSTSRKSQSANAYSFANTVAGTTTTYTAKWFTEAIADAVGTGYFRAPADSNKDGIVSVYELYNYTRKAVAAEVSAYNKGKAKSDRVSQSVAVYPTKDAYPVFGKLSFPIT